MNDMNDNANLNSQFAEVKAQLSQLSEQLAQIQIHLNQLPVLSEQVSRLQENFLLVTDTYRYEKLRSLLAASNWFEADKETIQLIMSITGLNDLEDLRPEDIRRFPCNDLQVIDRLWTSYSSDRFGFSIQLRAYQDVGGTLETTIEQNTKLVERWGEKLGWRESNRWRKCDELDYSLNAPLGCHPSRWWNSPYGSKMTNYFLSRLISCQLGTA
jgi:hypothetical protein